MWCTELFFTSFIEFANFVHIHLRLHFTFGLVSSWCAIEDKGWSLSRFASEPLCYRDPTNWLRIYLVYNYWWTSTWSLTWYTCDSNAPKATINAFVHTWRCIYPKATINAFVHTWRCIYPKATINAFVHTWRCIYPKATINAFVHTWRCIYPKATTVTTPLHHWQELFYVVCCIRCTCCFLQRTIR